MPFSPKFEIGDAIFAKMKGYPAWPAKVEGVADGTPNKIKYHVYFYGTRQIAVCRQEDLCPYLENRNTLGKPKKYKGFKAAIDEMDLELSLGLSDRPSKSKDSTHRAMSEIELACCEVLTGGRFQDTNLNEEPKLNADKEVSDLNVDSESSSNYSTSSVRPSKHLEMASRKRKYEEAFKLGLSTSETPTTIFNPEISKVQCTSELQNNPTEPNDTLLSCLKREIKLTEINFGIQSSLSLNYADAEACLSYLDDLFSLKVTPLMLKKHPEIVDTLFKVQHYVGNASYWKMSENEIENFTSKAKSIQVKAKLVYDKYQSMFEFPYGKTFLQFFADEVKDFRKRTSGMTADSFYRLIREPEESVLT